MTRREMLLMGCAMGMATFDERQAKDAVDHLVLGVADLDQGIARVARMTGVKAVFGGVHPGAGTRNALLSLGRKQYLEIIAPDPAQRGGTSRFGDLTNLTDPQLLTWAVVSKDINAIARKAGDAGFKVLGPFDGSRARPDKKVLRWKTMSVENEIGSLIPFFIEWGEGVVHPSEDSPQGCQLFSLTMEYNNPKKVTDMLGKLGIDVNVKQSSEARLIAVLSTPKGKVELS